MEPPTEPVPAKLSDPEVMYLRNRLLQLNDEKKRLHERLEANEADLKMVVMRLSNLLGVHE